MNRSRRVEIFERVRVKFRISILKSLYMIHLQSILAEGICPSHLPRMTWAKSKAQERLSYDLKTISFCHKKDIDDSTRDRKVQLLQLVPIVRKATQRKMSLSTICAIILMLYYGLILSEQSDESIPDMMVVLKDVLGFTKGTIAYNAVIKIASSKDIHCKSLRRYFLFGDVIELL